MKATKISFAFFGALWVAFESCGEWVKTTDGEYWQSATDWLDPETYDSREYARITPDGEVRPGKWWHILTEEQQKQINDFAQKLKH